MVFSSIRVSSLAIHRYLSPGLWKYRLKSTEKSWYFSVSNPAQKWNWNFHFCLPSPGRNLPVSCSARFYDGFEKSTVILPATSVLIWLSSGGSYVLAVWCGKERRKSFWLLTFGERCRGPAGVPKCRETEMEIPIPFLSRYDVGKISDFPDV